VPLFDKPSSWPLAARLGRKQAGVLKGVFPADKKNTRLGVIFVTKQHSPCRFLNQEGL
jgi:hypothetical protein